VADKGSKSPLDVWILKKIDEGRTSSPLSQDAIDRYQFEKLRKMVEYASQSSPFYRRFLYGIDGSQLKTLDDYASLPFTTGEDIQKQELKFLCVSQDEIARVVTLMTSSTTGPSKRLFFTGEDLELTIDFFHHGMSTLVSVGQRVLVLLPGDKRDSVGDLLKRGLARMDVQGIIHGPVRDVDLAIADIMKHSVDCLVGIPTQVLWIARRAGKSIPVGRIKSVLLSTDYIPQAIVKELERHWHCPVFAHYGMTEMGLGGAVECAARCGYHMREADLYVEIIKPDTGLPCRDGEAGEIVFTTLTRNGMPLIRYKTGDISRIMTGPCTCGSALRRLDRMTGRFDHIVSIGKSHMLTIAELDEVLFPIPGLVNYSVEILRMDKKDELVLSLYCGQPFNDRLALYVQEALFGIDSVRKAAEEGLLTVPLPCFNPENQFTTGVSKRVIMERRDEGRYDNELKAGTENG